MEKEIHAYLKFLKKRPAGTVYGTLKTKAPENAPSTASTTKEERLKALRQTYQQCTRCPLATQGRTNVVPGNGDPEAALMFIGEGPGRDEDLQGKPFVGRAGKLLEKILQAMGLSREMVYISNVVKCRPPKNRAPLPNESQTCKTSILLKEIEIIQPKIICTLGTVATQELLEQPISISKIRGTRQTLSTRTGDITVIPTFHPAYLLRNPAKKKEVWDDMQQVLAALKSFT